MISLKKCSLCGQEKPIGEFHQRHHTVKCGRRAACRDCTSKAAKLAREKTKKEKTDLEALKARVRARTQQSIKKGELIPQPCRVCRNLEAEAHHLTYNEPNSHLIVDWLCKNHHALEHGKRAWTRQKELFPIN